MPVATEDRAPGAGVLDHDHDDLELLFNLESQATEPFGGGDGTGLVPDDGGSGPGRGSWPLVPAILVVAAVAALLTLFSMIVQCWANVAGSQLPGA